MLLNCTVFLHLGFSCFFLDYMCCFFSCFHVKNLHNWVIYLPNLDIRGSDKCVPRFSRDFRTLFLVCFCWYSCEHGTMHPWDLYNKKRCCSSVKAFTEEQSTLRLCRLPLEAQLWLVQHWIYLSAPVLTCCFWPVVSWKQFWSIGFLAF